MTVVIEPEALSRRDEERPQQTDAAGWACAGCSNAAKCAVLGCQEPWRRK